MATYSAAKKPPHKSAAGSSASKKAAPKLGLFKGAQNTEKVHASQSSAEAENLSRAKLVGKFPQVQHLSAPKAKRILDNEKRKQLLASMSLT